MENEEKLKEEYDKALGRIYDVADHDSAFNISQKIGKYTRALKAKVKELEKKIKFFKSYFNDINDDMECLETCDTYAHDENCPDNNAMAAFKKLRERINDLEELSQDLSKNYHEACDEVKRLEEENKKLRSNLNWMINDYLPEKNSGHLSGETLMHLALIAKQVQNESKEEDNE